jgi:hypothetical protein
MELPEEVFILPLPATRIDQSGTMGCTPAGLRRCLDIGVLARGEVAPAWPHWERDLWRGVKGNRANMGIFPEDGIRWLRKRGVIERGGQVPRHHSEPEWGDGPRGLRLMHECRTPLLIWCSWMDGMKIPSGRLVTTPIGKVRIAHWEGYTGTAGQHSWILFGWCPTPEAGRVILAESTEDARVFALAEAEFMRMCNVDPLKYEEHAAKLYYMEPHPRWYAGQQSA